MKDPQFQMLSAISEFADRYRARERRERMKNALLGRSKRRWNRPHQGKRECLRRRIGGFYTLRTPERWK